MTEAPAEAPTIVWKTRDDALVPKRKTREERVEAWLDALDDLERKIAAPARKGDVLTCISDAMVMMAAHAVGMSSIIDGLEDRIAELEQRTTKPRKRVKAGSKVMT